MGKMPIQKSPLKAAYVEKPLNYNPIFSIRKAFSRQNRIKSGQKPAIYPQVARWKNARKSCPDFLFP